MSREMRTAARLQMAAAQSKGKQWYEIRNASEESDDVTEILIYDRIGASYFFGGVSAQELVQELQALDSGEIRVRINSPGGSVFEGIAILNALRAHEGKVTTVVEGLAASAASFIAMAGDEVVIRSNAELMIHDAWGDCIGNADEMREMAEQLDRLSNNIASVYNDKAGGGVTKWRTAMKTETWYSDQEALDAGLVDRIDKGTKASGKTKNSFDLSVFNFAGRDAAPPPPRFAASTTSAASAGDNKKKKGTIVATHRDKLITRLNLGPDATDAELLAALNAESEDEGETETTETDSETTETESGAGDPAESTQTTGSDTDPAAPSGATNAAPATVTLDQGMYEQFVSNSAQLQTFLDQQASDKRESVVNTALRAGKITAATAPGWRAALKANPDIERILDEMPAGGAVPVGEIGHGQDGNGGAETASATAQIDDIRNSDTHKNWRF